MTTPGENLPPNGMSLVESFSLRGVLTRQSYEIIAV